MNIETLKKLKKNPHYKLTKEQEELLRKSEVTPVIEFGAPSMHNQIIESHDVKLKRKGRRTVNNSDTM